MQSPKSMLDLQNEIENQKKELKELKSDYALNMRLLKNKIAILFDRVSEPHSKRSIT